MVVLVAGAILASSLVGVAAVETAQRAELELASALDGLAVRLGSSGCSARSPSATIDVREFLDSLPPGISSVVLYDNHLRAVHTDGHSQASIEFPALATDGGLELLGARVVHLSYEPMRGACAASVSSA